MKRTHVSWSNLTDRIQGPCVVCGQDVYYVIPSDRSDPALLHHATCDPMLALRERLKKLTHIPLLPPGNTIRFK